MVGGGGRTHLDEQSPPLPVPQLEVGGTVPLHHPQSALLLLPSLEGPAGDTDGRGSWPQKAATLALVSSEMGSHVARAHFELPILLPRLLRAGMAGSLLYAR